MYHFTVLLSLLFLHSFISTAYSESVEEKIVLRTQSTNWQSPLLLQKISQTSPVIAVQFCPKTNSLAIATRSKLQLWDIYTNSCLDELLVPSIWQLAFSPSANYLAAVTPTKLIVWQLESNTKLMTIFEYIETEKETLWGATIREGFACALIDYYSQTYAITWTSSEQLATCGPKSIRIWNLQTKTPLFTIAHGLTAVPTALSVSNNNHYITASSALEHARLFEYESNKNSWEFTKRLVPYIDKPYRGQWGFSTTAMSPDNNYFVGGCIHEDPCACAHIFDLQTKERVKTFKNPMTQAKVPEGVLSLSYTPNSNCLAIASYHNTCLWNTTTGELIKIFEASGPAAFSPDGSYLATVNKDNTIFIWTNNPALLEDKKTQPTPLKQVGSYANTVGRKTKQVWGKLSTKLFKK